MPEKPLCFVVMPFGMKKDPTGGPDIDFDAIYKLGIKPAIEDAGLEPIRADEEVAGGIIHKPMYERLMLCEYAVADMTTANANVFYEIGVRHAIRPSTTVMIFAKQQSIPFDVGLLRAIPYGLAAENRFGESEGAALRKSLAERLKALREEKGELRDSPIFQLIEDYGPPDIKHIKTDVFRERAAYSESMKGRLAKAREGKDAAAAAAIETELEPLAEAELGVLVDLLLSYRGLKQWDRMIAMFERLPKELKQTTMIREQLGFALNRAGRGEEALKVLEGVVEERGASSETCGLIGRVYKDRWKAAAKAGGAEAAGLLRQAIDAYVRGFEADWRDAYPGVNAVTLLDVRGDKKSLERKDEILPVVRYAVKQKMRTGKPDYWDYATLVELGVLESDQDAAEENLSDALARVREAWEPETTADNLEMIRSAREKRGTAEAWVAGVEQALRKKAAG
jgi:hypothetical protein